MGAFSLIVVINLLNRKVMAVVPAEEPLANVRSWNLLEFMSDDGSYAKLKPYLFVGSEDLSRNKDKLKEIGITHIINLATYCPNSFPDDFTYLQIKIFDMPEKDIKQHFQQIIDFIEGGRTSGGSVYVHCNAGISRAPTSCIAYLMWKDKVTKYVAFDYIRSKRCVLPNAGFMDQLNKFEIELNQVGSKATVDPEFF